MLAEAQEQNSGHNVMASCKAVAFAYQVSRLAAWLAPETEVLGGGLAAMVTINPDSGHVNATQGYTNAVCIEMLVKPSPMTACT